MEQGRIESVAALRVEAPLPSVRLALASQPDTWPSPHSWDDLARDAADPNPFFERWFLGPSLSHLGANARVQLLFCELDGILVGLLPIARSKAYYGHPLPNLSVWLHDNAFCGTPLVRRGFELPFWRAVLDWADRNAGLALFLHLPHLPADGRVHAALCEELSATGRNAAVVQRTERAMLRARTAPEEYFTASMSAKKRKELRRQHTRLSELGNLHFSRDTSDHGVADWIRDYLGLEARGWKGADGSALTQHSANAAIFAEALTGAARLGLLERLTLTLDDRPIAMLANFLTAPGAFSFKTAYDEDYARYSPGVLLQRENLDLLNCEHIEWTDSCAAADHPMIERIWREKRNIARVSIAIGGPVRQTLAAGIFRAERGTPLISDPQEH